MSHLANPELLRELKRRYFDSGQADAKASSHWRLYGERSSAETDVDGTLVGLSGSGFGDVRWASAAHRVLDQLCEASHLVHLPHRRRLLALGRVAHRIATATDTVVTLDAFRQVCTLELLERHACARGLTPRNVMIIGDGHGFLAALVRTVWPQARLTLVDLGRTLTFQAWHCQRAHPASTHALADDPAAARLCLLRGRTVGPAERSHLRHRGQRRLDAGNDTGVGRGLLRFPARASRHRRHVLLLQSRA